MEFSSYYQLTLANNYTLVTVPFQHTGFRMDPVDPGAEDRLA